MKNLIATIFAKPSDQPDQAGATLRTLLSRWSCRPRDARGLKLGSLEDRLLFSATPISPDMLAGTDVAVEEPAVAVEPDGGASIDTAVGSPSGDDWGIAIGENETGANLLESGLLLDTETGDDPADAILFEYAGGAEALVLDGDGTAETAPTIDAGDATEAPTRAAGADLAAVSEQTDQQKRRELVFVDTSTEDYQMLVNDLLANSGDSREFDVFLLDNSRDGIEQISEVLSAYDDLDAMHFVTHGTDAAVKLGGSWLELDDLDGYAGQIAGWQSALTSDADLLFYGCELAASEDGRTLIDGLSALTGADVAASTDDTGNASLGGDWTLEYTTGAIETDVAVSLEAQQNWFGLLATETVRDEFTTGDYTGNVGTQSWTGAWQEVNESDGPGAGEVQVIGNELVLSLATGVGAVTREADLSGATSATVTFDYKRVNSGAAAGATITFSVSGDGGSSWTDLQTYTIPASPGDATWSGASFDITPYVAANTQIRFAPVIPGWGELHVDNVEILYTTANAAPTATNLNAAEAYTEDTPLDLIDIVISDADSTDVTVTLTLSDVAAGSLSTGTSGTVTSTFAGGAWTASGAIADVNTLLAGVTFTPTLNYNSDLTIATSVDDGVAPAITGVKNVTGTAVNDAPVASTGGPYTISEGDSLTLDGSGSSDVDGDPLTYSWDIDNNGSFGDAAGVGPTLSWAQLQGFGINDDGTYTIRVQVDDGNTATAINSTTLTVSNTAPTLTTIGAATVNEGALYTLNVTATDPGNDSISSWTINWGDGSVDTIAGDPAAVTHLYGARGTFNILAAATDEDGTYLQNNLVVGGFLGTNSVLEYEATSGNFVQLIGSLGDGLNLPHSIAQGPDGNLYVSSYTGDSVLRYDAAGNFIDIFVTPASGGLNSPTDLTFGADGNLYVSSLTSNQILRYDGASGAFIDAFVSASSGGLTTPSGLTFGADGNLYVSSLNTNEVLRYNGTTGAFMDAFVASGSGGMGQPAQLLFGPDGNLYVASRFDDAVHRYNGTTGAHIDTFVTSASGGIDGNVGLTFGPDGNLYVSARNSNNVMRYDGTTGAFIDAYVNAGSGGLSGPGFITFVADQQVRVNGIPVAAADSVSTNEDTPLVISAASLLANDTDIDLDTLSIASFTQPTSGTVVDNGDGTFTYSPTANFNGADSFSYTVNDGNGGTDTATVNITVNPVNDAPQLDLDADDSSGQTGSDFATTFTEGGGPVPIVDVDGFLDDVDSSTLQSVTVTIANLVDGSAESLSAATAGTNIVANYNITAGVLTLTGSDTVA
ncbi:MAG: DUF4347 domain-containing protein, partial [Pirellulales bacterium]